MVLSRRELSAILLAVAAILFYLVLLSTTPSGAQTGDGTTIIDEITDEDDLDFEEDVTIEEDLDIEDDVDIEEDVDTEPIRSKPPRKEITREVVNIPNKPLPPSGGLPVYTTVAGFVLAGTGLLALGVVIRRGAQR